MDRSLLAFTERIEQANTIDTLFESAKEICQLVSVDHVVYHTIQWQGAPFAFTTYSQEWIEYYESNRLYLIDPVVLNAFTRFNPYSWKQLDWNTPKTRKFLAEAIQKGVGNQGLSFPVRGPNGELALFSVSHRADDDAWQEFIDKWRADLLLVGHFIHEAARRIVLAKEVQDAEYIVLSPREIDALTMLGLGLNRATVAENLQISEHTLRAYIESSRQKLGASNTTHAVATAMTRGLISI